jgi:hypothetical protein
MACNRAFSFTNDSADVAPPAAHKDQLSSNLPWKDQLFLRPLEPALQLYNVRHIESTFYQDLSQSGRTPKQDATPYTFELCQKLSLWKEQLPDSNLPSITTLFQLEFLYAFVVLLSPSIKVPIVGVTNWLYIFDSCIDYMSLTRTIIEDTKRHAFFTYFELLRVRVLGSRFIEALQLCYEQILDENMPQSSQFSYGSAQAPDLPFMAPRSAGDNCVRAIDCLNNALEILEFGRRRWNQGHLRDGFEQEAAVTLARLRARNAEYQPYPRGGAPSAIPVGGQVYGRRSQGDMGLSNYLPEGAPTDPTNPRRSRLGYSSYSSI